jgi:LacI family transcriptional regulator
MSGESRKRSVTIYDVAQRAAVSVSTVSRVMNGIAVEPAMADRVRAAAAELRFVPNRTAVNLSRNKTQTVGLLVPDLGNPTFLACLRGLEQAAAEAGYRVLVADAHEDADAEGDLARDLRQRCDALVLCAPRADAEELRRLLPSLDPVVVVNRYDPSLPAPIVAADYRRGIALLARHAISLGHRRLLYLAGNPASASHSERLAGLDDVAAEHPDVLIDTVQGGVDFDAGYRSADLAIASPATAVLAFNDLVAMGLLAALTERGVRVPQDLSIAGFDSIEFSAFTTPPLTTVAVPAQELGALAWERIAAVSEGRTPDGNQTLQPRLIARDSIAAASARQ